MWKWLLRKAFGSLNHIGIVSMRPGDTLVVRCGEILGDDKVKSVTDYVMDIIDAKNKRVNVLVLDGAWKMEVLRYRDEGNER
jgi:hypothetical protein